MQFLVSAKWIEGEAKDRGLSATDAEVKRQFEQTKDQSFPNEKAYQRFLKTSGQTEAGPALPGQARRALEQDPPAGHRGSQHVSDGEIEDYYNKNEQQFSQPERRDLEVILTKNQAKALEAKKAVEGGQKFEGRQEVLGRPRLEGAGRQAARRLQGPAGPEVRRGHLCRRAGQGRRPGQDRRRLLRLPGDKVTRRPSRASSSPSRASASCSSRRSSRRSSTASPRTSATTWREHTDCAKDYVIADCRNGREPTQARRRPCRRASRSRSRAPRRQPARPGRTGSNLAGGNGGGTVIGNEPAGRRRQRGRLGGCRARRRARTRPWRSAAPRRRVRPPGGLPPAPCRARPRAAGSRCRRRASSRHRPQAGGSPRRTMPDERSVRGRAAAAGAARARRDHAPPAPRVSLGPRAGRAQHRPAHRRGGVRARRRGAFG